MSIENNWPPLPPLSADFITWSDQKIKEAQAFPTPLIDAAFAKSRSQRLSVAHKADARRSMTSRTAKKLRNRSQAKA
jgi:hypothetical protein